MWAFSPGTYFIVWKYGCYALAPAKQGFSDLNLGRPIRVTYFKGLNVTNSYRVEPVFTKPGLYCFVFSPHWKDRGEVSGDVHVRSVVWPAGTPVADHGPGANCRRFVE